MSGIVTAAAEIALTIAAALTLICSYRIIKGPTLSDRMVALDTITTNIVAIGALSALVTGNGFYVLISLVLAIIGFISTVTVSMYIDEGDIIV
jgi:multicomponent Na+:H+ antiporter subunit F